MPRIQNLDMRLVMLATIMALQVADVLTTTVAVQNGIIEQNPLMAMVQSSLGGWWFAPKLALVLAVLPLLLRRWSWKGSWIIFAICLGVVCVNLLSILSQ